MKKNLVILILLVVTIIQCFLIFRDREGESLTYLSSQSITTPDTIFLPVSDYQEVKPFKVTVIPNKVTLFRNSDLSGDSLLIELPYTSIDSLDLQSSSKFDSISQIILKNDWLQLTTKNTLDSSYKVVKFKIDPLQYNYNWVNNQLSSEKRFKPRINPYIRGSYRPFNKFWDLNSGIRLETKKLNYNLGINLFYYPSLQKSVGKDLEISITYKFN